MQDLDSEKSTYKDSIRSQGYSPAIHVDEEPPEGEVKYSWEYFKRQWKIFSRSFRENFRPEWLLSLRKSTILVIALAFVVIANSFIFSFIFSFRKEYPSVLNFGDMMFDRGVRNIIENRKRDPFEYIKRDRAYISKYDLIIANLEGPIVEMDRTQCQQKLYNFQFPNDTSERIKMAGIKMVNIANNHSFDCYKIGYTSTKENLQRSGIEYIGENVLEKSYVTKVIHDKKFVFIGIDQTIMPIPLTKFYPLIRKLKSENDYVVVNIHWGIEYQLTADESQREIARKLVDNGADVVFGSHPHVVEPVEIYNKGVIFYSLGNFVFDQDFGDTTVGIGAGVEFQKDRMLVSIHPFNIKKFAPELMKGQEMTNYCENFLSNLESVGCNFEVKR